MRKVLLVLCVLLGFSSCGPTKNYYQFVSSDKIDNHSSYEVWRVIVVDKKTNEFIDMKYDTIWFNNTEFVTTNTIK